MENREIVNKLEQTFSSSVTSASNEGVFPYVVIKQDALRSVLSFCVEDIALKFDFLDCMTGLDTGQDYVIIYHLLSTTFGHRLNVKVSIERHSAKIPTATGFWSAANAYELEIAEMFGIKFDGHPNPRQLLLPEDWHGHPLRKDYVFPDEYHGVEHRRAPLRREHARP